MGEQRIGLLGKSGLVGDSLLPLLIEQGKDVVAFSRDSLLEKSELECWISTIPIWILPQYFDLMQSCGAKRIVALSSTSVMTKSDSSDQGERATVRRLMESEARLQTWCEGNRIEWVILRPTLIYGFGRDKNITEIARFIGRFGFFPILGRGTGLRQPVHAEDVATACVAALEGAGAANRAYNISGGESLAYHDMVRRVFIASGRSPRLLTLPLWAFNIAIPLLRILPRYRHWTTAMVKRMDSDLVFDHADATRDIGFLPRPFILTPEDVSL